MAAIRLDNFVEPQKFKQRMDEWIRFIRSTRKSEGTERVWLPGEKEIVTRNQRIADGINLNIKMVDELKLLASEAGVVFEL
jgi:L-2-hydroxycarboxylate dehydrogenase (NAD+)